MLAAAITLLNCHSGPAPDRTSGNSPSPGWTVAINPQFSWASDFSEGLASVRVGGGDAGKWGFIDKQGRFVINPQYGGLWEFSEGLAAVRLGGDGSNWGFIDKQGKIVISPQFESVWPWRFQEGLAAVQVGDDKTGKWGFIDHQGNFVVHPQFDYSYAFSEGLAKVGVGRDATRWGFIDKQSKFIVNPQFDDATDFKEGMAAVRMGTGELASVATSTSWVSSWSARSLMTPGNFARA